VRTYLTAAFVPAFVGKTMWWDIRPMALAPSVVFNYVKPNSWLVITFSSLRAPAYIQNFACKGQ
ncbi:MAG: hypothetical protein WAT12_14530, partial [Candidatus Nitrotoga sp.]